MEPAWRQQGRGRGRGQNGPSERPRPLRTERERPGGKPTAAPAQPEPPSGEDEITGAHEAEVTVTARWSLLCVWLKGVLVQSKFEEIRKSNQAAAQRLAERHMSSSSSSDDDDDNDEDCNAVGNRSNGKKERILASTFNTYADQTGEL